MEKVERYVFINPSKKDEIATELRELGVEMDYGFGDGGVVDWGASILIHLRAPEEVFNGSVSEIDGVLGLTDYVV